MCGVIPVGIALAVRQELRGEHKLSSTQHSPAARQTYTRSLTAIAVPTATSDPFCKKVLVSDSHEFPYKIP
jgi:hypothetical protein